MEPRPELAKERSPASAVKELLRSPMEICGTEEPEPELLLALAAALALGEFDLVPEPERPAGPGPSLITIAATINATTTAAATAPVRVTRWARRRGDGGWLGEASGAVPDGRPVPPAPGMVDASPADGPEAVGASGSAGPFPGRPAGGSCCGGLIAPG